MSSPFILQCHAPSPIGSPAHSGFTLIEVLVALSVMAVGLLGMAALQLQGLRGTHDAALRTQAVILATDAVECLRVNARTGSDVCGVSACEPPSLSDTELSDWRQRLADRLPQGEGNISKSASGVIVTVQWHSHDRAQQVSLNPSP